MKFDYGNHPARHIIDPTSDPDYASYTSEVHFTEMVLTRRQPHGEWVNYKLGICPLTGSLMYMPPTFPVQWMMLEDPLIDEAWLRYSLEKSML